jgi:hypothetical protein
MFLLIIFRKGNIISLDIINSLFINIICRVYIRDINLIFLKGDYSRIYIIKQLPLRKTKF